MSECSSTTVSSLNRGELAEPEACEAEHPRFAPLARRQTRDATDRHRPQPRAAAPTTQKGITAAPAPSAHGLTLPRHTAWPLQVSRRRPRWAHARHHRRAPARRAAACPPTRRPKAPQEAGAGAGSPLPHAPSNALTCVWAQFPGGATRRGAEYVHARARGWRHRPRSAPRPTRLPPPPCRPVPTGGAVPGARSPAGTSRALPPLSPVALSPGRPALRWRQAGCCLGLRWTPSPGPRVLAGARGGAAVPAPTHAPLHLPAAARLQLPRLAPPADSTAQRSHAGGGGKADWNTTEPRPTGRLLPQ